MVGAEMGGRATATGTGRFHGGHRKKNRVAIVLKSEIIKTVKINFNFFISQVGNFH